MAPEKVSLLPFLFSSLLKNFKTFFNCCVKNEKFYAHSFSILVLCFCVLMSVYKTPSDHSAQPGVEHPALRGCSRSAVCPSLPAQLLLQPGLLLPLLLLQQSPTAPDVLGIELVALPSTKGFEPSFLPLHDGHSPLCLAVAELIQLGELCLLCELVQLSCVGQGGLRGIPGRPQVFFWVPYSSYLCLTRWKIWSWAQVQMGWRMG